MKEMKFLKIVASLLLLMILSVGAANAQAFAFKKWKGTYPEMNNSYPLAFISFRGFLPPIPHLFIRMYPTHYYWKVVSVPVTDANEIAGITKTGFLRIAAKLFERSQMKGRYKETGEIKLSTFLQKEIENKLFNSRSDQLSDIYQLADRFIRLYQNLGKLNQVKNSSAVKRVFEKEADDLLMRFMMVNFLKTGHGEKLDSFSDIYTTINKLEGEIDYTRNKMNFFNSYNEEVASSYVFLTK